MKLVKLVLPILFTTPMLFGCGKGVGKYKFIDCQAQYVEGRDNYNAFKSCGDDFPKNETKLISVVTTNLITASGHEMEDKCIHFTPENLTNECIDEEGNAITNIGTVNHKDIDEHTSVNTCNYGQAKGIYHFYSSKGMDPSGKITFKTHEIVYKFETHDSVTYTCSVKDTSLNFEGSNLKIVAKALLQSRTRNTSITYVEATLTLNYSRA